MKFTAKRSVSAAVIGFAAIVTPISLTVLSSGPGTVASAAPVTCTPATPGADAICYVQSASSPPDTYQYDNGVAPTPQTVTVSGSCASVSGAALLNTCGWVYPSSTYPQPGTSASGASTAALGTNGTATGVGAVSPSWTIDNKTSGNKSKAEAIDFSPGPAAVVANRFFSDAQIQIQRKDSGVAQNPSLVVELAELDSARNVLATQDCTITGGTGTQILADTNGPGIGPNNGPGTCHPVSGSPATPSAFQTVEVRDTTNSTSISVVGTSTFTLQNAICGGGHISLPPGSAVNATITDTALSSTDCKTYTSFAATATADGTNQNMTFGGGTGTLAFSMTVTWAPQYPACQPDSPSAGSLPQCAPTTVSFDGNSVSDQAFCAYQDPNTLPDPNTAPPGTLCTYDKEYTFVTVPVGNPAVPTLATQITEKWIGKVDCCAWHR